MVMQPKYQIGSVLLSENHFGNYTLIWKIIDYKFIQAATFVHPDVKPYPEKSTYKYWLVLQNQGTYKELNLFEDELDQFVALP